MLGLLSIISVVWNIWLSIYTPNSGKGGDIWLLNLNWYSMYLISYPCICIAAQIYSEHLLPSEHMHHQLR